MFRMDEKRKEHVSICGTSSTIFKQKKGQLQNRKQRKILKREQYTKETAVIDTTQAVQVLEKIRPCEKRNAKN